ncbi:MAG: phosphate signaling complex protein PhoU [Beijerinckiaceae bacterium]
MTAHIVSAYDAEIKDLQRKIAEMGGIAEKMLSDALMAIEKRDVGLAQQLILTDSRLDGLQRDIDERAILTIARRQPMAIDLREIFVVSQIAGDIERVGDLVKNIGKRIIAMEGHFPPKSLLSGLRNMSLMALGQFKAVLDAYTQKDVDAAMAVWSNDGGIDKLYNSLFRELLTYMMEDPRNITFCTHLLFSAKNIERIGDHATNIAERIYYVVTGDTLMMARPKGDDAITQMTVETNS